MDIYETNHLVIVDTSAKLYDNWSKNVEAMHWNQIFHLTLDIQTWIIYVTHCLVLVYICANLYWSKDVDAMHLKQIVHMTSACDLDL